VGTLSDKVRERMRQQAAAVREGLQGSGGRTAPMFDLTGKNALVQAGGSFFARLLPRWDIAQKFVLRDGKWEQNPQYEDDFIFFVALEHWWDDAAGKPNRVWCPRSGDEAAPCPLCEAAEELLGSADQDDRQQGKRIGARRSFLFNAVVGRTGKRQMTPEGHPDIRVLPVGNTLFASICSFMTGDSDNEDAAAFARGDISDPRDGYDLMVTRPAKQNDRWKADCAPQSSPLCAPNDPAWGDWMTRLVDLPEMVRRETKTYEALYQQYFGEAPPAAAEAPSAGPTPAAGWGEAQQQPVGGPAPSDPWASAFAAAPPASPPAPTQAPTSAPAPAARPRRPSGRP